MDPHFVEFLFSIGIIFWDSPFFPPKKTFFIVLDAIYKHCVYFLSLKLVLKVF